MEAERPALPEESTIAAEETFPQLLSRLSRLSVTKHYDAYGDVSWDAHRIVADDPLWQLPPDHSLGATTWYRSLPPAGRSRVGLHVVVCAMQTGAYFENVLTRGLLEFTMTPSAAAHESRYAYHEIIEESQHTLMFREFVQRSGLDGGGPTWFERKGGRRVVGMARHFPELFFLFVLGGEDPIDYVQRTMLRGTAPVHPLLRRIMQIHITEEARHLCFARAYLREHVPRLGWRRRLRLSIAAPIVLGTMARRMLEPPPVLARTYRIPKAVLAEAFERGDAHRTELSQSLAKARALCRELGLVGPIAAPLWRIAGIA